MKRSHPLILAAFGFLLWIGLLSACDRSPAPPSNPTETPTATAQIPGASPTPTTPDLPTPTPAPLAVSVNGWGVTLAEYQAELVMFQSSEAVSRTTGTEPAPDASKQVLDSLIGEALLAQAAQEAGFVVDDATLQARLDRLAAQLGSPQALGEWMVAHSFTEDTFRLALRRSIAAAWMRDQIVNGVPIAIEQIHARQILLYNSNNANQVLSQLNNGADFATLAFQNDPIAGGDLGWFPQGYLLEPEVEKAAFALQPGQFSPVVQTQLGYHIIQVVEREPERPLEPGARLILQEKALQGWLQNRRSQSQIQTFVP